MGLVSKLAFQFDRKTQYRGQRLFDARSVRLTGKGDDHARGHVADGRLYEVTLTLAGNGRLGTLCNCPQFRAYHSCMHVWAVILQADREGALSAAAAERSLKVARDGAAPLDVRPIYDFGRRAAPIPPPPQPPPWQDHLSAVRRGLEESHREPYSWPPGLEIVYAVDVPASRTAGAIVVELFARSHKKNGEVTAYKEFRVAPARIDSLPDAVDAEMISLMLGGTDTYSFSYTYNSRYSSSSSAIPRKALPYLLAAKLIPMASAAGRLMVLPEAGANNLVGAAWDEGDPWKLWLEVRQDDRDQWNITGSLRRGSQNMPLTEPLLLLEGGFVVTGHSVARFDAAGAYAWVEQLRKLKRIPFPDRDRDTVLANLLDCPRIPPMEMDAPLQFEERRQPPSLGLRIVNKRDWNGDYFEARLLLDYGRGWMLDKGGGGIWVPEERVYVVRDPAAEAAAREALKDLGLKPGTEGAWRLGIKAMPRSVRELVQSGWHVEAEGKAFRRPGEAHVDVRSGIDWFELHAEVDYGGATATLPQLLAALRRGDTMVPLGDGTFGLLPEEWLARFAPLAGLGSKEKDHLRFRQNQAGLLDALLAAQPEVHVDEMFQRMRERVTRFHGVKAVPQPEGFQGQLRDYQREGLGWMEFLREFGFGGCLADDMGVGKTAQVLAVVEGRRGEHGPSLVVAPKSLMFNWREESARFTPQLRVLEHTGTARDLALIAEHDLVLTTYGTLLRDAASLSEIQFDYVVLDEAQAVKNASTASAKAVRLLRGAHRLALSGTPVENHLGELWSLFEFLNPGMLGEAKVLKMAGGLGRNPSEEARQLLAQALRPFILRRTKQQVARELPEKTEQTIYCELEGPQRQTLRRTARALSRHAAAPGGDAGPRPRARCTCWKRCCACGRRPAIPGCSIPSRWMNPAPSWKRCSISCDELREEGHKALVFSQFTSLLAIVRRRLDEAGVRYEYLDGATRDRQAHAWRRFRTTPACSLFLISLKAGGLGLNLTAAEYVFLLDPWWNPAVEAQAVDRAHRIGQTKPVFAYRLIARDTVEEKVLELQKTKRELADAILGEDNSLIRDLKKEDLELLLS